MSKLSVDQKTIYLLLNDKHADFLIPDYQRPYAWTLEECETLYEDLWEFAFPNNNCDAFNRESDEYYLGLIVTFRNENRKLEIIDGQQRLTTIMLLLRAFYDKFTKMKDTESVKTREAIEKCVWKTDEFGGPDLNRLKIDSEVASDDDKDQFLHILREGTVDKSWKSAYAINFDFFQKKIQKHIEEYPTYISRFAIRILNNVILLPIEAESQETALRIFSTLNDRGLPLSDADIFKSQYYKFFKEAGEKAEFIAQWKDIEDKAQKCFGAQRRGSSPLDEIFTRYMYFERAKKGITTSSTESLRTFFSTDKYALLKSRESFQNLQRLADFWFKIYNQDDFFSEKILKQLVVLNYSPNSMWSYLVSTYFLANCDENNQLDEQTFSHYLDVVTGFVLAYTLFRPGVNALRTPVYPELVSIIKKTPAYFKDFKFDEKALRKQFDDTGFTNQRPITRSMLVWWAYQNPEQQLFDLNTPLQIEHIYAKRRAHVSPLQHPENIESLGNKAMLEQKINIRASDYRFEDKVKYYEGKLNKGRVTLPTKNAELRALAKQSDFSEEDIESRQARIVEAFIQYLKGLDLIV